MITFTTIDKIGIIGAAATKALNSVDGSSQEWTFNPEIAKKWHKHYSAYLDSFKGQWENAIHNGDCIKQCCSCMACFYEEEIVVTAGVVSRALAVANVIGLTQQKSLEKAFWKFFHDSDYCPVVVPDYVTRWAEWVINEIKEEDIVL